MAYADQQMSSSKVVSIILVIVIHVLLGYALVTGLAYNAVKKVASQLDMIDIQEEEPPEELEEPPPPPPDQPIEPPPVVSPPPIVAPVTAPRPTMSTAPSAPPPAPPAAAPPPPPPPAPPPPPSQARGASPKNQGRWAGRVQQTYPTRAQREERQGTVRVRLTIDGRGRVSGCSVSGSSGHADLDAAACKALRRYGRYNPALDAAGNPTTGSASTAVRYTMN